MEHYGPCSSVQACVKAVQNKITNHPLLRACHSTKGNVVKGKFVVIQTEQHSGPGKSAFVQIYSSTVVNPSTGKGRLSEHAYLSHGKSRKHSGIKTITYRTKLRVEPEFGIPGAFVITNQHKHKFFLESAALEVAGNQIIRFDCRSWVYPIKQTKSERLFFSNTSYLPNQTPTGLLELRKLELTSLRGDGTGERNKWDRIYDYDCYNDLGCPDKGDEHDRPVLGGSELLPYPRRVRTGRPPGNFRDLQESWPEMINLDVYVPLDEQCSPKKLVELSRAIRGAVHFLIPEAISVLQDGSSNIKSLDEIRDMFSRKRSRVVEGKVAEKLKKLVSDQLLKEIIRASKEDPMKFPLPEIIAEDKLAWSDDEEFGHQVLAGINPTRVQCLKIFPPEGKYGHSAIRESDIVHNLEGLTLKQVMSQWRLFILDHHDYLMPFLDRINENGVCAYASRTLFFLRRDATLMPVAIELSLPEPSEDSELQRVFLPASEGTEAALWQLAKAHVLANDSAYHQLVSHWLHTHAVVEPFIIATRRQLSVMHPIHRLLDPHFKDTIHINALARNILINSGGILEKILFTGKISMELSSALYKEWRFDEQAVPADLLKRRMALEDPDEEENPNGVGLLFQDYPYGADALDIWRALKAWITAFCFFFYKDDESVKSDIEIQAWWSEIQHVGHGDKCNETWWCEMTTRSNLIQALTTLTWIASALHASVNFGQYTYAGYPPNRPTKCRKFIPEEGTSEFADFLQDPDKYYLNMLPRRNEMAASIALVQVLSQHTSDEEYLGQRPSEWTDNQEVQQKFKKFNEELRGIEKNIIERNSDPDFKNRRGPARIPYNLLYPDTFNVRSKGGITGKGIPNSISI